jgi:hypothetical protein
MLVGCLAALVLYGSVALIWALGWTGVLFVSMVALALLYVLVPERPLN